MINFLIKDLYKIKNQLSCEPNNFTNSYSSYELMHNLSIQSYKKNLKGTWTLVELMGEKNDIQDCFKSTYLYIKECWHKNYPCNILYTNADTLCVNEIDIFNQFNEFRLFTDDDPIVKGQYINGGVKYFPSHLSCDFWTIYDREISNWNDEDWLYEQNMGINLMFSQDNFDHAKSQNWVVKQIGLVHKNLINELNCLKFTHAILHFHSSQNPVSRLHYMEDLWRKLND